MKASEFKPGQRVRIVKGDGFYTDDLHLPIEGTVLGEFTKLLYGVCNKGYALEIRREDGLRGFGHLEDGAWICITEKDGIPLIEIIGEAPEVENKLTSGAARPHIMGLDREEIDPGKYREYMKTTFG